MLFLRTIPVANGFAMIPGDACNKPQFPLKLTIIPILHHHKSILSLKSVNSEHNETKGLWLWKNISFFHFLFTML